MEVLFWLLPAAVVTTLAMVAVGWWGREGRGEVDRETAARRLGEALARDRGRSPGYAVPPRQRERPSGIAVRPSRSRPVVLPGEAVDAEVVEAVDVVDEVESVTVVEPAVDGRGLDHGRDAAEDRRAS